MSLATLLAQHNDVVAVDIVQERVDKVNRRQSPIQDDYIEAFLDGYYAKTDEDIRLWRENKTAGLERLTLSLEATTDWRKGYDSAKNFFDTSAV